MSKTNPGKQPKQPSKNYIAQPSKNYILVSRKSKCPVDFLTQNHTTDEKLYVRVGWFWPRPGSLFVPVLEENWLIWARFSHSLEKYEFTGNIQKSDLFEEACSINALLCVCVPKRTCSKKAKRVPVCLREHQTSRMGPPIKFPHW